MLAHREPVYRATAAGALPHSEAASARSLLLPLFPQMGAAAQQTVIDALESAANPG
jgi:dTDP-4-amino-4,6-dideoxygalactose transaminase